MQIKLIDFGGKVPKRFHPNDAGADVYSTINVEVKPHSVATIPLGFGIELPDGYMGIIMPRSGLSSEGLIAQLPPIDSGYKGEIHGVMQNSTNSSKFIWEGDRIAQLVILPIIIADFVKSEGEQRGKQGFGSTGNR